MYLKVDVPARPGPARPGPARQHLWAIHVEVGKPTEYVSRSAPNLLAPRGAVALVPFTRIELGLVASRLRGHVTDTPV